MEKRTRVRFAPSPTGPLHMGGVRTALYNYLFAKKYNGDFILRIEDTDQSRFIAGAEEYIINALNWCGLEIDEGGQKAGDWGPYRQSQRKEIYFQYVKRLIDKGFAYYAFDSPKELSNMRDMVKQTGVANWQYNSITRSAMKNSCSLSAEETKKRLNRGDDFVVRVKLPRNENIKFHDLIRGWVSVNTNHMDDKVLFKADGMPTYHLANVVDDHLMKITHVIRGEEWLPSAPLHVFLHKSFGWDMPEFAHLPLILKPDGNGKLSKRDGDRLGFPVFPLNWTNPETKEVSQGYKEQGFLADAFINMLAMLGWNPGTEQEIFSKKELIDNFSLDRVGKAGAKFDFEKTKWYNHQYIMNKTNGELARRITPLLQEKGLLVAHDKLSKICAITKERATYIKDLYQEGTYLFKRPDQYDKKVIKKKWKEHIPHLIAELGACLESVNEFSSEQVSKKFQEFLKVKGLKFGQVGPCFRLAITGVAAGPSMFDICEILGKQEVLARIKVALENI